MSLEPPDPQADPDDWTVSLDDDPDARNGPYTPQSRRPGATGGRRPRATMIATGLLLAGLLAVAATWRPGPDVVQTTPRVIGAHLVAPISFRVPAGATATSDSSYLGVRYPTGAALLVTAPTEVLTPAGERAPLSTLATDPADWLRRNPAVFVSRVREVELHGRTATQVDYRRSDSALPRSAFAGTSLFCAPSPCTRITSNARVRATFLQLDGRTVLAEAVWRTDDPNSPDGRSMPRYLNDSYRTLLGQLAGPGRKR